MVLAASLGTRGFFRGGGDQIDVDKEISRLLNYKIYSFGENTCICSLDVCMYIYTLILDIIHNNVILYIYTCISLEQTPVVDVLNSIFMLAPLHGESH